MNEHRIIISGFGGQGILMLGKLLASAGMNEGKEVSWLPSYGPEMRGGTANCHVILSDSLIGAPIVTEATCVIAMNLPSLDRFQSCLVPGGVLLLNSSMIPLSPTRQDLHCLSIPVNEMASAEGSIKVANVVMLGAFLELTGALRVDGVIAVLEESFGKVGRQLIEINLRALEAGRRCAAQSTNGPHAIRREATR